MAHGDRAVCAGAEATPSRFRQPCLVLLQQIAGHLMQRRDDRVLAVCQAHPIVRGKSLRPADMAVTAHVDDRFVLGIDAEAPCAQPIGGYGRAVSELLSWFGHDSSAPSRYPGRSEG